LGWGVRGQGFRPPGIRRRRTVELHVEFFSVEDILDNSCRACADVKNVLVRRDVICRKETVEFWEEVVDTGLGVSLVSTASK
jgi:hypothetical protein